MIVDNALYRKGERVEVGCGTHDLAGVRAKATEDHDFVWVGLHNPTSDHERYLAEYVIPKVHGIDTELPPPSPARLVAEITP